MREAARAVLRLRPRPWAALAHLLQFALVFALFMGRKPGVFRWEAIPGLLPGFYGHVYNFALSWILLAGVGFVWLMMGVPTRLLAWAALGLAVANVAYEFLLPLMNTRDPLDAAYGVLGTLLAFAWLWIAGRAGMRPMPDGP